MLNAVPVTISPPRIAGVRSPTALLPQHSQDLKRIRSSSSTPRAPPPTSHDGASSVIGFSRELTGTSRSAALQLFSSAQLKDDCDTERFSTRSSDVRKQRGSPRPRRGTHKVPSMSLTRKEATLLYDDGDYDADMLAEESAAALSDIDEPSQDDSPSLRSATKQNSSDVTKSRSQASPLNLPVIDLRALTSNDSDVADADRRQACRALHDAMIQYGFIYVDNHGVPRELLDKLMGLTEEFFDLPQGEKDRMKMDSEKSCRGYLGFGGEKTGKKRDCHESVDLMREHALDSNIVRKEGDKLRAFLHGPNEWPTLPEALKPTIVCYNKHMQQLGATIMSSLALANDLPVDYFDSTFKESFWTLRMLKYPPLSAHPPLKEGEDAEDYGLGCGEHTDYGFLSFVYQDKVTGCLQVKDAEGRWIDADPKPGMFVVNLGDMLRVWSNNMYPSTPHRVQIPRHDTRYSLAYFYEPGFDQWIEPEKRLSACVDGKCETKEEDATSVVERVKFGDHLVSKFKGNFGFLSS